VFNLLRRRLRCARTISRTAAGDTIAAGAGQCRDPDHLPQWWNGHERDRKAGIAAMYFKQLLNERCGCASYVIASRRTREAAIVDPAVETEPYEAVLRERDFRLQNVIDTHIHADHVSGARRLVAQHGGQLCLHESAQVDYPFRPLSDRQELELG